MRSFRSFFGLPSNDPVFVHNGPAPGTGTDDEPESDLDVEWAGAVAPRATVKFVISKSTNTTDGIDLSAQYVVDHNLADTMSTSYGLCEAQLGSGNAFYNSLWAQAAAQGITSFVSSGDTARPVVTWGRFGRPGRPFPASARRRTTCVLEERNSTRGPARTGPTISSRPRRPSRTSRRRRWNESGPGFGLWSSGGGASTKYAKPSWQATPGVPADSHRDVPDVSLTAAGHDGYVIAQDIGLAGGGPFAVGGTSASSPAFAGLMALIVERAGARQGNANVALYRLATNQYVRHGTPIFHDITAGNNSVPGLSGFSCQTGYDLVTGLGSVDATALLNGFTLPGMSVGDVTLAEGNVGTSPAAFQVTLSAASTRPHGPLRDGRRLCEGGSGDYVAASGTLTFTPGQTSKAVNVTINGDTLYEGDETFSST